MIGSRGTQICLPYRRELLCQIGCFLPAAVGNDFFPKPPHYIQAWLLRRSFFCLFSSRSHSRPVRIPFSSSPFCLTNFKRNRATEKLSLCLAHTLGLWRFTRKFTTKVTVVNFPSADWLSYLKTQLKAFVGGVCFRSKRFFSALFSGIIFFA